MNLQQIRYICEVARQNLKVSAAAEKLHTSQPGISKQIKALEEELGVEIFNRRGKHLVEITPPGRAILQVAERILDDINNIKSVGEEYLHESSGSLSIATTHTQACYALPPAIKEFTRLYPNVQLNVHQGSPPQVAQMASDGTADVAIATEALRPHKELVTLPCYEWNRVIITPTDHPLLALKKVTLQDIVNYPILTYVYGFTGRYIVDRAFAEQQLEPKIVFTATDSDVIKTYVDLGLGIGIIAGMAFDEKKDSGLRAIDASHLFDSNTTVLGIRHGLFLRGYIYAFIELFAPNLTRSVIDKAIAEYKPVVEPGAH